MSVDVVRWPGFWNRVNSASSSRTMITQSAKLRRLAFIRRPSARRNRRPVRWPTRIATPATNVSFATPPAKGKGPQPGSLPDGDERSLLPLPASSAPRRCLLDGKLRAVRRDHGSRQGPPQPDAGFAGNEHRLEEIFELAELDRPLPPDPIEHASEDAQSDLGRQGRKATAIHDDFPPGCRVCNAP